MSLQVLRPKAQVKSHFVKPELRRGILPSILAALIEARATTRAALKDTSDPSQSSHSQSRLTYDHTSPCACRLVELWGVAV